MASSEHKEEESKDFGENSVTVSAANCEVDISVAPGSVANVHFSSAETTEAMNPTVSQEKPPLSNAECLFRELGLKAGDEVGRYLLLSPLGAGGMGVVFSAYDPDLDRKVALKFIRTVTVDPSSVDQTQSQSRSRLMQEAKFMAQLSHPNVVAIYDVGEVQSHIYLAMEMIEGQTLKAWIRAGRYKWTDAVDLLVRAGKGLASAHDAGLVHRDFKPDNVLLGQGNQVCVADFGLVYQQVSVEEKSSGEGEFISSSTTTKQVLGTPSYMSPEQHRGDLATAASDQFSFCVCLYEALYGVRPFLGRNLKEIVQAIEAGQFTEPSQGHKVPRWLHQIVMRGLSFEAEDRFPSMQALLAELSVDRGLRRTKVLGVAAVSLLSLVGVATLGEWSPEQNPACRRGQVRADGLWSGERRSQVEKQFLGSDLGYARAAWNHMDTVLGQRREQWGEAYAEVCEVSDHGQDQIDRDLKMDCLHRQAEQMQTLVGLLANADHKTIERSVASIDALSPITDCLNEETLKHQANLPSDPQVRQQIVAFEDDFGRLAIMQSLGKYHETAEQALELFEEAKPTGYTPFLAKTSLLLSQLHAYISAYKKAGQWLDTALIYAEKGKNEALTAQIVIGGLFVHGYRLRKSDEVDEWMAHAKAHVLRAGNSSLIRAKWRLLGGAAHVGSGRIEEGLAATQEAVDIYERELGPNHTDTLVANNNVAYLLQMLHRFEEAESVYRRVIAVYEANLGRVHPLLTLPVVNLAELLEDWGRYDDGLEYRNQSVEIAEASQGVDNVNSSQTYISRAKTLFFAEKYSEASDEWRRIISNLERVDAKNPFLHQINAWLARTLLRLGNIGEAKVLLQQIDLKRRGPRDGEEWVQSFVAGIELALATEELGKAQEILSTLGKKAGDIFSPQVDQSGEIRRLAGDLEMAQDQPRRAYQHYLRALERAQSKYPGDENANLLPYRKALARAEGAMKDLP